MNRIRAWLDRGTYHRHLAAGHALSWLYLATFVIIADALLTECWYQLLAGAALLALDAYLSAAILSSWRWTHGGHNA